MNIKLMPRRQRTAVATPRADFDDLINRFLIETPETRLPPAVSGNFFPALNVAETDKTWNLSLEVPGMSEKDVHVRLEGRTLVLSGERNWEEEKKGKEFYCVESQYGAFERRLDLPDNALCDADSLTATCKKGMLEITIPKTEPTRSAKIAVKAG